MTGSKDLPPSTTSWPRIFFHNQFRAKPLWSLANSCSGQTALITGGNTGLGYQAALQLLQLNLSRLIIAVRSPEKGETAASKLRSLSPTAKIEVWELDMSSYPSIQSFAHRLAQDPFGAIHMTILNSGVIRTDFHKVESTGHEETIQVNYLSTVLLAILLLPILKSKAVGQGTPPRLTIVSAALTMIAKLPNKNYDPILPSFDDPKKFESQEQYNSSKLLCQMFLWKLVDYVSAEDVIVNLADPAWCKGTGLTRDVKGPLKIGVWLFGALTGRSPRIGASCLVDAVVNKGKESHGCFLMSWKVWPFGVLLYTVEGREVVERVWEETLRELGFANVRGVLVGMRRV
ncbi:NAD(P)-binding protein [Podospora fimiseda]|uniref:NAD(P)-binding protein n=1 Tax=Podospora fimiseda TaxID=252190 RepID=A0AAN6YKK7_9PEZI|nr:NAD(P)-binding protein [Podospora fimiseda]